jgi:uncharacterized RDD family membrane protein YckC
MDLKVHAGMDRPIHCPARHGSKTIVSMASSTQERFRGESLPVAPPPTRTESGTLMVYIPPPAPVALTDLLQGFRAALQVADKLPPVLTVRAGDGTLTRRVQVPRLRMFLRYFLNQHVCRRLAHLERAFHADAAVGIDRMGELAAIDHFEQAVPAVPVRRIFIWFAVSVLFSAIAIANVAKALAEEPLTKASSALRGSIASVISVDTNGLIDAAGKFDAASGVAAVIVISLALYLISALPITSFRLKRMLLNLSSTDAQKLADAAALDHVYRADGIYRSERAAFQSLGVPPPREIPFDLIAQATLMLLPLLLGISLAISNLESVAAGVQMDVVGTSSNLVALAWLFLVVPLGRLAHVLGIWRRREADARGADPPHRFTREELCLPRRRFGAFLIDSLLGVVASIVVLIPIMAVAGSGDLVATVWWFLVVPVAFAAVTIPFMVRTGEHAGQSLGKQLLGMRVVCDSHGVVTARRAAARELLVKGPFWTGSISLLFIPAIVNGVWSILDPERRGLQDRAAGTRVVRATRPQQ